MAHKVKSRVNMTAFLLFTVLLLSCLLAACQPTPLVPPVVNKAGGISGDMIAEPLAPGVVKDVDAPHWTETTTRMNGRITINADVDIEIPENLSNTPVYKLEQVELTPKRLAELTHYFVGDSKLYKPLPMTKFEGMEQLKKLKDPQSSFGENDEFGINEMSKGLQTLIDKAPDTAVKEYTDLSFTLPYKPEKTRMMEASLDNLSAPQAERYVDVIAQTGEEYEPEICASTFDSAVGISGRFAFTYPGSFSSERAMDVRNTRFSQMMSFSSYRDQETVKAYSSAFNKYTSLLNGVIDMITETPEQALSVAQAVLNDLGINDVSLDTIEKGVWQPRQPQEWDEFSTPVSKMQGGYEITFTRSAGQLAGFRLNYSSIPTDDMLTYTPPFRVEQVIMFVSNGKIIAFDWRSMSKAIETIAANTNLIPFDEIKERFTDYVTYNYPYQEGPDGEMLKDSIKIDILSVELRSSQITAKDDPYKAWLVPSWLIWFQFSYLDEYYNIETIDNIPCEINALDGGIIIPVKLNRS